MTKLNPYRKYMICYKKANGFEGIIHNITHVSIAGDVIHYHMNGVPRCIFESDYKEVTIFEEDNK